MLIIQIEPLEGTSFHPFQGQSHRLACWLEGYVEVPESLITAVTDSGGWCDLTISDGVLVGVTPTVRPEPAQLPTPEEDRDAMLIDLAFRMTLLELGVN